MEPWEGSTPPAMSFAWQSQAALTRSGTLGDWLLGFLKMLGGRCHHQLSRHAVSGSHPSLGKNPHTKPAPCGGLADAVQGRDRSSSSELRALDSIDARFQFLKTRFRVVVLLFTCHRASGSLRPLTQSLLAGRECVSSRFCRIFDSVERKGFEPSTPGLQSRCSPN